MGLREHGLLEPCFLQWILHLSTRRFHYRCAVVGLREHGLLKACFLQWILHFSSRRFHYRCAVVGLREHGPSRTVFFTVESALFIRRVSF